MPHQHIKAENESTNQQADASAAANQKPSIISTKPVVLPDLKVAFKEEPGRTTHLVQPQRYPVGILVGSSPICFLNIIIIMT